MSKTPKGWRKSVSYGRYIKFTNKTHKGSIVEIFKQTELQDYWEVRRWDKGQRIDKPNKEFDTKRQVIKFAHQWMSKHPRG